MIFNSYFFQYKYLIWFMHKRDDRILMISSDSENHIYGFLSFTISSYHTNIIYRFFSMMISSYSENLFFFGFLSFPTSSEIYHF